MFTALVGELDLPVLRAALFSKSLSDLRFRLSTLLTGSHGLRCSCALNVPFAGLADQNRRLYRRPRLAPSFLRDLESCISNAIEAQVLSHVCPTLSDISASGQWVDRDPLDLAEQADGQDHQGERRGERGVAAAPAWMGEAHDGLGRADRPDTEAAGQARGNVLNDGPSRAGCGWFVAQPVCVSAGTSEVPLGKFLPYNPSRQHPTFTSEMGL